MCKQSTSQNYQLHPANPAQWVCVKKERVKELSHWKSVRKEVSAEKTRVHTVVYTHIAVLIVQRCWITEHYPSQLTSRCIYIYIYLQFVFVGDRDKTCPNRNWYIYQLPSAGWGSLWAGSPSGGRRQYRLQHGISCTDWPTNLGQWATG